jgi:hypothetical protein
LCMNFPDLQCVRARVCMCRMSEKHACFYPQRNVAWRVWACPARPTPPHSDLLRTACAPTSTHSNGFCVIWVCISSSSSLTLPGFIISRSYLYHCTSVPA